MTDLQLLNYAFNGVIEARKKARTPQEKILLTKHVSFLVKKIEMEKTLIKIVEKGRLNI